MGKRGPAKEPTQIKKAKGNPGGRPLPENEPMPRSGAPTPPKELSAEALEEWRSVVPALDEIGMLSRVDAASLSAYCAAVGTFRRAEAVIAEHGEVITTPNGCAQTSPWVSIRKNAIDVIKVFSREYGLTPSARSSMSLPTKKKDSSDDDFVFGGLKVVEKK